MSNTRGPGQKLISVPMNEKFIELIDAALPEMGYSDRSSFIRDAISDKIRASGIQVPPTLTLAPSRTGKGGRPSTRAYEQPGSASSEIKDSPVSEKQLPVTAKAQRTAKNAKYKIPPGMVPQGVSRNYKAQ